MVSQAAPRCHENVTRLAEYLSQFAREPWDNLSQVLDFVGSTLAQSNLARVAFGSQPKAWIVKARQSRPKTSINERSGYAFGNLARSAMAG